MRKLRFLVSGQALKRDPECNFREIVPGSVGFLQAQFDFDREWAGLYRAAEFGDGKGGIYPVLIKNGICDVPAEVCGGRTWTLQVVGKRGSRRLPTNRITVVQEG